MEQKPSTPIHSPELPPVPPAASREAFPAAPSFEAQVGNRIEQQEQRGESPPSAQATLYQPTALPVPVIPAPTSDDTTTPQDDTASPSVASDDELIEKEWVDKAKKVIAETKDDPYRREKEVNELQADYIFKRYGRKIGSAE